MPHPRRERGKDPDKPYSGKFVLRVDPQLHRALAAKAAASETSMNTYVEERLKEMVGSGTDGRG